MTESDLEPERRNLLAAAQKLGEDLAPLSKRIERNQAYLNQYIWRGTPRRLEEDDRKKLSMILSVPEEALKPGAKLLGEHNHATHTQRGLAKGSERGLTFLSGVAPPGPRDLPILGHVKAGERGYFLDQGEVRGYAMRPESLKGNDEAYAVRVHDESMSPRFEPGWVLQVDPWRHPRPGDHVVIQLNDDQALVKLLVRKTEKVVICRQFRPAKEIEYKRSDVKALHFVVGIDFTER